MCFRAVQSRYKTSEKGRATNRRYETSEHGRREKKLKNARTNARRVRVGKMYLGSCGFTVSEMEAILDGSTD